MKERDTREIGGAWRAAQRHGVAEPGPVLAPFVERIWWACWSYARPYRQVVVPFPGVHLTVRPGCAPEVHGVATSRRIRELDGEGRVTGVEFRPGGFRPFLRSRVAALTDRVVGVADVPGLRGTPAEPGGPHELRAWLEPLVPAHDPAAEWAAETVALVAADRTIVRVDQLAELRGTHVRGLQRRFAEYVGVGPKRVIRRYRLREVTERMAHARPVDWAALAAELGFADQAHLARDFAALFGEPLTHYAARY
ncbi:AraC family transcriptional regulator [Pseudonocardia sp. CA-107938]|uniref:AraC family transcriptional regulator n=1 Tax=Pseudonocardia sp. CA-107938 TaxID=3240021 RepID=UPI003D8FBB4D